MAVSQKGKQRVTIWPNISIFKCIPQRFNTICLHKNLYTMSLTTFFHNGQRGSNPDVYQQKNGYTKCGYPHTWISFANWNKWNTDNAITWMTLENMASERGQTKKRPYIVFFHLYELSRIANPQRQKVNSGCQRL